MEYNNEKEEYQNTSSHIETLAIENIEKEIMEDFDKGVDTWVKLYRKMEEVDQKKLFRPEYKSLTEWVKSIAKRNGWSVATLWHRRSAGRFYDKCYKSGGVAKPLEEVRINPENLNVIEKIVGNDMKAGAELIEQLLNQKVSYSQLRLMWQGIKQKNNKEGLEANNKEKKISKSNGYEKVDFGYSAVEYETKVMVALSEATWLYGNRKEKPKKKQYRLLMESLVDKEWRPDATVVESMNDLQDLKIHTIEVRAKFSDYTKPIDMYVDKVSSYCDYMWIVFRDEEAEKFLQRWDERMWEGIGVLKYDSKSETISICRQAQECIKTRRSEKRIKALSSIITKLL